MRYILIYGLCGLLIFLGPRPAVQARQPEIAARPLGMGEAFLAIADDGNVLGWNPAGLPWLDHHEIIGSRAEPFASGIQTNNLGYIYPLADNLAFGFDWHNLNSEDTGLNFNKNSFRFSYGHRFWRELSLGMALRRVQVDMSLDNLSLGNGTGWGYDLAAFYAPTKKASIGLVMRDFTATEIRYDDQSKGKLANSQLRIGAAYKPTSELTLAADVDERLHLGAEYWYKSVLALRAGYQKDLHVSEPPTYSAGGSLRYQFFQFDYALVIPPTLAVSSRFSFSLFFNLYPAKVRIAAKPQIQPVFPAFAHRYAGMQALGQVKLVNQDNQPHQAILSFYVPELMDVPAQKQLVILPKETRQVALDTVLFSSRLNTITEPHLASVQVQVAYTAGQRTRAHKVQDHLFVYGRNHTQWDDVRKAAAFITPLDPQVEGFSRPLLVEYETETKALGKGSSNLIRAMVLFEALKEHGVRYVADPNNPYHQMAADADAVDHIKYPAEVLAAKTGDCDDLTVLYCALLENAGINTALVNFPDHIFMMFATGVTYRNAYQLPIDKDLYVLRGDQLWIPVEITLFGQSFLEAWRAAADQVALLSNRERQRQVVDTAEAWAAYAPSPPPSLEAISPLNKGAFQLAFLRQYAQLNAIIEAYIDHTYLEELQRDSENNALWMQLAKTYVAIGQSPKAITVYEQLVDQVEHKAAIYNNMGIAYLVMGQLELAADHFSIAMNLKPGDMRIRRHFDRALLLLGQKEATSLPPILDRPPTGGGKADAWQIDEASFFWLELAD